MAASAVILRVTNLVILMTILLHCAPSLSLPAKSSLPKSKLKTKSSTVADAFRLAAYYGDHMVLQRQPESAVIWGYAVPGAQITTIFKDKKYLSTADANGEWQVTFEPQPPSGPFTMKFTSDSQGVIEGLEVQDVLFGDVWVCSGQSNMAFDVKDAFNGSEALMESYQYSHVRVLAVTEVESDTPLYNLQSVYEPWSLPSPDSLGAETTSFEMYFSAVCWFFGRDLYDHLQYPIGMISSNWGGTPIEAWSPPSVLKTCNITSTSSAEQQEIKNNILPVRFNETKPVKSTSGNDSKPMPLGPAGHSVLWNAMIHPLLTMAIKGVVWYQGEDNAVRDPSTYNCLFPAMISEWRRLWQNSDPQFPFGFVQLCNSENPNNPNYTSLRWHQTADYGYVPNPLMPAVFMAVSVDLLDLHSPHGPVHPRDKEDVSARLLLGARAVAYNESYTTFQGPFPTNISSVAGPDIQIQFNEGKTSLTLNTMDGFDVCCGQALNDCPIQGNMSWLNTTTTGLLPNTTVQIKDPCPSKGVAVRYIWRDVPCKFKMCPLYDTKSGLPVPPFFLPVGNQTADGRSAVSSENEFIKAPRLI